MKESNVLLDKSLKFAARIVKLHHYLISEKKESIINYRLPESLLTQIHRFQGRWLFLSPFSSASIFLYPTIVSTNIHAAPIQSSYSSSL